MKADTHIAPYFAKSIEPVFGLNHLGLRNAAESLFTTLLPGLNGVTERVRYYSFYCWLTGKFRDTTPESQWTRDTYRLFIRKSEILLALIHVRLDPEITGIPGVMFARGTLELGSSSIDLKKCVYNETEKRHTDKTYWANPGGVLRQYYNASMKDMALLPSLASDAAVSVPSEKIDLPDDAISGRELGLAFEKSIGLDNAALFLECVKRERVSIEELDTLKQSFIMKGFGDIGVERDLLIDTFNQKDYPQDELSNRSFRKETIRHFLTYCQQDRTGEEKDSQAFPFNIYEKVLSGKLTDDCALGWYAYHLNDEWQYNSSIIFSCVLKLLEDDGGWVSIKELSSSFARDIVSVISDNETITLGEVCELIDADNLPEISGKTVPIQSATAILNILSDYCSNRNNQAIIKSYKDAFPEFHRDDVFSFMEELDEQLNVQMKDFLTSYIQEKIIYRHHMVSLMKYCQTGVSSNKILVEDGYAMYLNQTECTHTSPRILSLIDFITDLGLLHDMKPTLDAIIRYNLNTL